jgi:hypothetical protein
LRGGDDPPPDALRRAIAWPPFEPVLRRLLVAEAAGAVDSIRRIYAAPLTDRAPWGDDRDSTRDTEVTEPRFTLRARTAASPRATGEPWTTSDDPNAEVGVQVEIAGLVDWRTHFVDRSDELGRLTNGRVLIERAGPAGPPGPDAPDGPERPERPERPEGDRPARRSTVWVMGSGGLAQRCAVDLLDTGVERVVLLVPPDEVLLPAVEASARYQVPGRALVGAAPAAGPSGPEAGAGGPTGLAGLEVARFTDEQRATDVLMEQPAPGDALLVIDTEDGTAVVSDKMLERLSLARVRRAAAGLRVPAFFLCCRGLGRAERLRNFVVDEVIDATSYEASYLTAFATVYFEVLPGYRAITHAHVGRRIEVAHGIAARLCHLDVWRPSDVRFVVDGGTVSLADELTPADLVRLDRSHPTRRGPLIGVIGFPPPDEGAEDEVAVRVDIPVAGLASAPETIGPEGPRLVVGIPYL